MRQSNSHGIDNAKSSAVRAGIHTVHSEYAAKLQEHPSTLANEAEHVVLRPLLWLQMGYGNLVNP